MWFDLLYRKDMRGGSIWCALGDFNYACFPSERFRGRGSSIPFENVDFLDFYNIISLMGLVYLSLLGRKCTWFQPNGGATSRLGKILVSNG